MLTRRSRSRRVEDQRQDGGAAVCGVAVPLYVPTLVELYVGHPPEQGFEGDARLLFGQGSAEAAVRAEAQVPARLAGDVEAVRGGDVVALHEVGPRNAKHWTKCLKTSRARCPASCYEGIVKARLMAGS